MRPFLATIANRDLITGQIERLASRQHGSLGFRLAPGLAVTAQSLREHAAKLGDHMLRELRAGIVPGSTPTIREITPNKKRIIAIFPLTERILHGVVAEVLSSWVDQALPSSLYSYRRGIGPRAAIDYAANYVTSARAGAARSGAKPDIFVLRRDVKNFGPSIPIHTHSSLWPLLQRLLLTAGHNADIAADAVQTVQELLAGCATMPVGSALVPLLSNVYLADFDRSCAGLFPCYLRFGDDILAMTTSAKAGRDGASAMSEALLPLALEFGATKSLNLVLHPAGVGSDGFQGTAFCEYLGFSLRWDGYASPSQKHMKRFWQAIDAVLRLPAAKYYTRDNKTLARFFCLTLRRCLSPHESPYPEIPRVLEVIDDRRDLKRIDFEVALRVAQRSTGVRGNRAFRHLSYRTLQDLGLPSLVMLKNRNELTLDRHGIS